MRIFQKGVEVLKEEGIIVFSKKLFNFLKERSLCVFLPYFIFRIKKSKFENLEDLLNFVFSSKAIGISQEKEEILELLKILEKRRPKNILEIGTAKGGTLFLFSKIADEKANIISIDLPQGKFGGGYPKWKIPLYKSFVKGEQKIFLLREDSHHWSTLEKIKKILDGQKLDFLFIDGDHSYEGVKKDFEMYSELVQKDGIIALHDIVPHPPEEGVGVPEFWREIRNRYRIKEIVKNWDQNWAGIGLIHK